LLPGLGLVVLLPENRPERRYLEGPIPTGDKSQRVALRHGPFTPIAKPQLRRRRPRREHEREPRWRRPSTAAATPGSASSPPAPRRPSQASAPPLPDRVFGFDFALKPSRVPMARFASVGCLSSLFVLTWMRAAVDPSSRQISYSHVMKMVGADAVMEIVWGTDLSALLFVL
jgi:hypothetical protein